MAEGSNFVFIDVSKGHFLFLISDFPSSTSVYLNKQRNYINARNRVLLEERLFAQLAFVLTFIMYEDFGIRRLNLGILFLNED
jgi:hypothetical protein